jgi:hypothetical protein
MQWEGTSDSNNKQDANIATTNTLCDCDSVVLSAVSGSYMKCRSVQPVVRTQGETHLGKSKERPLGATQLFISGFSWFTLNRNQPLKSADDWLYLRHDFCNIVLKPNTNFIYSLGVNPHSTTENSGCAPVSRSRLLQAQRLLESSKSMNCRVLLMIKKRNGKENLSELKFRPTSIIST